MASLAQIKTKVDRYTGIAVDTDAQTSWINDALALIAAERDWPWLDQQATITGDGTTTAFVLPTDYLRTQSLNLAGAHEIRSIAMKDMDRWAYFDGRPTLFCYATQGTQLIIKDAIPVGQTVTHRYTRIEPALAAASDTPLLPDRFTPALVAYVAMTIAERTGDAGKAAGAAAELERWRKVMIDESRRSAGPKRVRVRDGYGW